MANRYFANPFPDFSDNDHHQKLVTKSEIVDKILSSLKLLEDNYLKSTINDFTIYTGLTGIVLLYIKLSEIEQFTGDDHRRIFLQTASDLIEKCLKMIQTTNHKKRERYTFLCGSSGVLTCKILIHYYMGTTKNDGQKYLKILHEKAIEILNIDDDDDLPDELLYGRSGFLYSLLFIRKNVPESVDIIDDSLIKSMVAKILESGRLTSKNEPKKSTLTPPLVYYWHQKGYVGAAHGYAGIMYMLLEARDYLNDDHALNNLIRPTIDFIIDRQQFPSTGNYRSSLNNDDDRLIQWCHGSPGVVHLLLLSYEIFNENKYLSASLKAADDIWKRGLLKKGCGLCHGTAGNGYAFLRLYQHTNNEKYLYRAMKFGEWCMKPDNENRTQQADRPYSLFEGLAGTIYFLADLLQPKNSKFPAFQISEFGE